MSVSTATYSVSGMTCGHCAGTVSSEVRKIAGVTDVAVDVPAGTVTVTGEDGVTADAVAAAVKDAGYEVMQSACCSTDGGGCSASASASR